MNLANKITLSRIFLIPIFMFFIVPLPGWLIHYSFFNLIAPFLNFINQYGNYLAAVIFIIASSTDAVDGYIARKMDQITNMGKFLDPIADKLLVTAALIALVERHDITTWTAMIIISRELIVTGFRMIAAGEGIVIAASNWGKIKTVTQIVAIVAALIDNFPLSLVTSFPFDNIAMAVAIIVTIYSGYVYIAKNYHVINVSENIKQGKEV